MLTVFLAAFCGAVAAALTAGPIGRRPAGTSKKPVSPSSPIGSRTSRIAWHWTLGAVGAVTAGILLGWAVTTVSIACVLTARRALLRRAALRRRDAKHAHAQELLSAFATELQAGRAPTDALLSAAEDLATGAGSRVGIRMSDPAGGLAALADRADPAVVWARCDAPVLRQLAAAWRVSETAGIPLAPLAGRLAAVVRTERERNGEVTAALAGPRASGRLVASLPAVGIALGAVLGISPLTVLLGTPAGHVFLVVGVALDLAGMAWLDRIVDRAARLTHPAPLSTNADDRSAPPGGPSSPGDMAPLFATAR